MPRPLRIDYPGAYLHVTNRGRNHQPVYRDHADRELFLEHLAAASHNFAIEVHAFALMDNHYHLLLKSLEGNLSNAMQLLGSRYVQDFNAKHSCDGSLCKGRFYSKVIDNETYLLEAARYIPNNPVKAGLVDRAQDYPYSSYAITLGLAPAPEFLAATAIVDEYFDSDVVAFDAFVRERDSHQSHLFAHIAEGSGSHQSVTKAVLSLEVSIAGLTTCPLRNPALSSTRDALVRYVRAAFDVDLCQLASPRSRPERDARLMLLTMFHRVGVSTIGALATAFGLNDKGTAHRAIRQFEAVAAGSPRLGAILDAGLALVRHTP